MSDYSFTVTKNLEGIRIDKVLVSLSGFTRSSILKSIKNNSVKINDQLITHGNIKVKDQDIINIEHPEKVNEDVIKAAKMNLDIIYEDQDIIVINKNSGISVHPGPGNYDNSLVNGLVYHCNWKLSDIRGYTRPGIVHRLDKDTTGLMVVAKNNKAHLDLALQIKERSLTRIYKALVWGIPNKENDIINKNIGRSNINYQKMRVFNFKGKESVTEYKTDKILNNNQISLLTCKLQTGRTHQIRVHLSSIGHSVVGDQLYGHNKRKILYNINGDLKDYLLNDFKRQALHSSYLKLKHPTQNKYMEFECKIPEDMSKIIDMSID